MKKFIMTILFAVFMLSTFIVFVAGPKAVMGILDLRNTFTLADIDWKVTAYNFTYATSTLFFLFIVAAGGIVCNFILMWQHRNKDF